MDKRSRGRKKASIFRIFLVPLIVIMLVQSMITMGTLVVRRTAETLAEYSGGMMNRLVENRRVILQNDMNQRWASVNAQEGRMTGLLEEFWRSRTRGWRSCSTPASCAAVCWSWPFPSAWRF